MQAGMAVLVETATDILMQQTGFVWCAQDAQRVHQQHQTVSPC